MRILSSISMAVIIAASLVHQLCHSVVPFCRHVFA